MTEEPQEPEPYQPIYSFDEFFESIVTPNEARKLLGLPPL